MVISEICIPRKFIYYTKWDNVDNNKCIYEQSSRIDKLYNFSYLDQHRAQIPVNYVIKYRTAVVREWSRVNIIPFIYSILSYDK